MKRSAIVVELEDARIEGLVADPCRRHRRARRRRAATVGSASAATTDATSSASAPSPSRRSRRSSSRLAGMGSRLGRSGARAAALERQSRARARRTGCRPDVSQSRISVGRGKPRPRRARSSSCSAPMLSPSIAMLPSAGRPVRSDGASSATSPRTASSDGDGLVASSRARANLTAAERGGVEPLEVVDREHRAVAPLRATRSVARNAARDGPLVGLAFGSPSSSALSSARRWIGGRRREHLVDDVRRGDRPARRTRGASRTPSGRLESTRYRRCGRVLDAGEPDRRSSPIPASPWSTTVGGEPLRSSSSRGDRRELVRPTDQRRADGRIAVSPSPAS